MWLHLCNQIEIGPAGEYTAGPLSAAEAVDILSEALNQGTLWSHIRFKNTARALEQLLGQHVPVPREWCDRRLEIKPGEPMVLVGLREGVHPKTGQPLNVDDLVFSLVDFCPGKDHG
jgi:hypothetical protein